MEIGETISLLGVVRRVRDRPAERRAEMIRAQRVTLLDLLKELNIQVTLKETGQR